MKKSKILFIGALPPPHHGVSIANDILVRNGVLREKYEINVVRIRKDLLQPGGNFSLRTLLRDSGVILRVLLSLLINKPSLTYFGLGQTRLGLWRDVCLIWLSTFMKIKCLLHLHGSYFRNLFEEKLSSKEQRVVRRVLKGVDGIIVLDASLRWIFHGLVPSEKIFVLANGLPDIFQKDDFREIMAHRQNSPRLRVTYLGNLVPGKGFETFLEAAAILEDRGPQKEFFFNLAGAFPDGAMAARVKDLVRSLELEDSIRVPGKVLGQEKRHLLLNTDTLVFPSYKPEGQPLVIIEALAAGLPIISTSQGSIPSMVREGVNGFIVEANNPARIAERLLALKENPALRVSMSQASRDLFLSCYHEDKFVQGFATIVDRVLENGLH